MRASFLLAIFKNIKKEVEKLKQETPEQEDNPEKEALESKIAEHEQAVNLLKTEYEEKLAFILKRIAFLCKYKMVSIREIKVNHPKNQIAKFNHHINILNSSDSDFAAKELEEEEFAESNSILMMKSLNTFEEYLNLSPLIIDTNSEIIDNKDKFDIKKDIFMYTKFRNDHLMYIGTEVTDKCDLRSLNSYQLLLAQFKDMMETVSGEPLKD